jgi:1,4-dihydroxy-2-naphthoate octaprenyltransferase
LNQVFDIESDRINNKVGFLQRGYLTVRQLKVGFWIVSIIPLVAAAFISTFVQILFAQFLLLSWLYSAPPVRLKDRALLGFLANAHAHGLLVALAVAHQTKLVDLASLDWHIPVYFALTVGATYILTTITDRAGDEATGKRTVAVVLGRNGALVSTLVLLAISVALGLWVENALLAYLAIGAVFMVLAALMVGAESAVRLASKMPLLALTVAAGSYYPVYFAFVVALLIGTRAYYFKRFGIVYPELA